MIIIVLLFIIASVIVSSCAVMFTAKIVNAKNRTFTDAFIATLIVGVVSAILIGLFYLVGLRESYDDDSWIDMLLSLLISSLILSKVLETSYLKGVLIYIISGLISLVMLALLAVAFLPSGTFSIENITDNNNEVEEQEVQIDQLESHSELEE